MLTVHDAARYLRDREVRAVGVVDAQGAVVGVLSQSDISDKVAAENKCPAWLHVQDIMSTSLVSVSPAEPVNACLRLMEQHNIYHLLVIDTSDDRGEPARRFRGMLSISDVLRVIALDEKSRADMLEAFAFERVQAPG
jgi:CBS domain-containing protein